MYGIGLAATNIGARKRNEDAWFVSDELQLYIVCDGMGGHAAGHIASRTAVTGVEHFVKRHQGIAKQIESGELPVLAAQYFVEDAVKAAAESISSKASRHPECIGMGTTITMVLITRDRAIMAHVGDSRCYLHRDGVLEQLSDDHTLAGDLVRSGVWTEEKGRGSRLSHILTRCLGTSESPPLVDTLSVPLREGDRLLLCSDGLASGMETQEASTRDVLKRPFENLADDLVNLAWNAGVSDNMTLVAVDVHATATSTYQGLLTASE